MLRNIEAETRHFPLTVIVADKHPIARAALASLLTYDGYQVFQADSVKMYDLHERGLRLCLQKPINYNDVRRAIEENVLHRPAPKLRLVAESSSIPS